MQEQPEQFAAFLQTGNKHQVQILYTQINRDAQNLPTFKSFGYGIDPQHYFYPASTVKLAAVIFALEKVNRLEASGLSIYSHMLTDTAFQKQSIAHEDSTAQDGKPSIAHYIKKTLLTSDNDAFNRLFEFIGRAELNAKLKEHGLLNSRILNRLAIGDGGEYAKHTNPIRFYNGHKLVYSQEAQYDPLDYPLNLRNTRMGKAYINSKDLLVMEPFDFSNNNVFSIPDQQQLLKKLMFPEAFPKAERYSLKPEDYSFIYTYMSLRPEESTYPSYDPQEFGPHYAKMLYYGRSNTDTPEPNLRIFNKYGNSYGFIIDNAYIVDFENKIEYMLTAVVQGNANEIYNDNIYEYESLCYPFMKNIARSIHAYELKRKRAHMPNLSRFKVQQNP